MSGFDGLSNHARERSFAGLPPSGFVAISMSAFPEGARDADPPSAS
jgi:hypothetical protein